MKKFDLDIFTPYGHYLTDKVDFLKVSSEEYTLGILPDHSPLISTVKICEIDITKDEKVEKYATSGGIIKIENNKVELLLDTIESEDEIDLPRATSAKERAENRLKNQDLEPINVMRAKMALERAINRIKIKQGLEE